MLIRQEHSDLNWEFEVWSFLFCLLNYALFPPFILRNYIVKNYILIYNFFLIKNKQLINNRK